ncbi:hypothetical protein BC830DRAFT_777384 [Chytriomyces sp. MP71]|nr:hypothetical protein BC830DRAFT_777384 [Chytriomyces sp. MP71]
MTKRVNSLSKDLKEVLENAVCIGQTFDVRLLSLLLHQRTAQVTNQLWDFLKAGFIKPIPFTESKGIWRDTSLDGLANHPVGAVIEYNFAFESVYEEIYNSISSSSRERMHLKIARLIYAVASSKSLQGTEIEICKHYNLAISIVSDHQERKLISSLNLQAAELAMSDFNFDQSKTFLANGIKIFKDMGDPWSHSDHLFFNLNLQMAKCLVVDGGLDEAKALLNVIEAHSQAKCNIYKVYYLQRHLDAMFGDFPVVLREGRSNLNDLGITIPSNIGECKALAEDLLEDIEMRIKNKTPQEIINLSKIADEESDMIQVIMLIVAFAAYRSSTRAMFALLIAMVTSYFVTLLVADGRFAGMS